MKNLILKEEFFKNLTPFIQERTISLLEASKIKNASKKICIFVYCAIGILFIYFSRNAFFDAKYFSSADNIFDYAKFLVVITGAILISEYITKTPKDNYHKAVTSLKKQYLLEICDCNSKCKCKNQLAAYLKRQGIDLLK